MTFTISENARAVLLPAFDGTDLSDGTKRFLDTGGVSILVGESREEYVGRRMSNARRAAETPDTFIRITGEAKRRAGHLLTAIDQELAGICRLHDLVPQFPSRDELDEVSPEHIQELSARIAAQAAIWGVNVFLAPVLDVLSGPNAWLEGRTVSANSEGVARLSAAYIRGVQSAGVAAVGKHFPGYGTTTGDPAIQDFSVNALALDQVTATQKPFHAAIAAGVEMIMVGPAVVVAYDRYIAALRSPTIVNHLKTEFGFRGVVMADDLDSKATMRGDSVATVAIDALNAGCDFLLLADTGSQLDDIATAIEAAAQSGAISEEALAVSAGKVRALAAKYSASA